MPGRLPGGDRQRRSGGDAEAVLELQDAEGARDQRRRAGAASPCPTGTTRRSTCRPCRARTSRRSRSRKTVPTSSTRPREPRLRTIASSRLRTHREQGLTPSTKPIARVLASSEVPARSTSPRRGTSTVRSGVVSSAGVGCGRRRAGGLHRRGDLLRGGVVEADPDPVADDRHGHPGRLEAEPLRGVDQQLPALLVVPDLVRLDPQLRMGGGRARRGRPARPRSAGSPRRGRGRASRRRRCRGRRRRAPSRPWVRRGASRPGR